MTERLTCDEIRELAAPFVLGALEADEMDAVRAHLADCPDAHAEFLELGSVVPALAESVEPVEPPAALKGRILAAAAADPSAVTSSTGAHASQGAGARSMADAPRRAVAPTTGIPPTHVPPSPFPSEEERTRRADRRRRTTSMSWALRAAAVLAIVVLGGWNVLLQGRLDATEAYNRDVAAVLDAAAQPGAMTAILAAQTPGGPRGIAALDPSGALTLAVRGLGPTSGTQVYETWAIVGDEAPVALGGFTVGAAGTGRFDGDGVPAQAGLTVALTLEPSPGATAPSSAPVAAGAMTAPPGGEALRTLSVTTAAVSSTGAMDGRATVRP